MNKYKIGDKVWVYLAMEGDVIERRCTIEDITEKGYHLRTVAGKDLYKIFSEDELSLTPDTGVPMNTIQL
jgi:hypothetical protein